MGRVYGIAVVDVVATLSASYVISKKMGYDFWKTTVSMFAVGELTHVVLGIKTPVTKHIVP